MLYWSWSASAGREFVQVFLHPSNVSLCPDVYLSDDGLVLGKLDVAITNNNVIATKTWDSDDPGDKAGPVGE